jgi:hypothetical protein
MLNVVVTNAEAVGRRVATVHGATLRCDNRRRSHAVAEFFFFFFSFFLAILFEAVLDHSVSMSCTRNCRRTPRRVSFERQVFDSDVDTEFMISLTYFPQNCRQVVS